jgi:hypothetical protein
LSNLESRTVASRVRFPQKRLIPVATFSPGCHHPTGSLMLPSNLAKHYEALVDFENARLPMLWWLAVPAERGSPIWPTRNSAATKLLRQPSTTFTVGGLRKSDHVIDCAHVVLPGSVLRSCIIIPSDAPSDAEIIEEAGDAIGAGRVYPMADSKRRYLISVPPAASQDEKDQRDSDLCWASLNYC